MKTKAKREKIRRLTIGLPWDVWRHYKRKSVEECRKVGPQLVVELKRAMAEETGRTGAALPNTDSWAESPANGGV